MNAVCGILDRRAGEAEGLDAMLTALAGYGEASARWEGDAVGLGCRGPDGAVSAPSSLRFDAEAGVAVFAAAGERAVTVCRLGRDASSPPSFRFPGARPPLSGDRRNPDPAEPEPNAGRRKNLRRLVEDFAGNRLFVPQVG